MFICNGCKRESEGRPRTSNGMGEYCKICIPDCKVCDSPVNMLHASKCNLCWEVEYRLDAYLKSPKARIKVRRKLENLNNFKQ